MNLMIQKIRGALRAKIEYVRALSKYMPARHASNELYRFSCN